LQVRAEGVTERLGDINLQCSGGAPGSVLSGNLNITLPVNVTNRVDANNLSRDAVLFVEGGGSFPGLVSGHSVSFYGVSFTAPAGSVNLRISGMRGAVSQFGTLTQQPVIASVSSTFPVSQAQVVVAYPQVALTTTLYNTGITCTGSPAPASLTLSGLFAAGTAFASTRLTEGFAQAFQMREAGADNGVRIVVKYSGFPANARLYVPDAVAGSDAAVPTAGGDLGVPQAVGQYVPGSGTLVLVRVNGADSTGAGGLAVFAPQGSGAQVLNAVSEVALSNGSGYAVYEIADANPAVQESAQFPTFISLPTVTAPAVAMETVSLGPVSAVTGASATAPVVRFAAGNPPSDCTALGDCNASYFPKLMVDATPIRIAAKANGGAETSASQYVRIRNGAGGLLAWNVTASYQSGAGWLTIDSPAGTGNATVRVAADTKSLGAGTYQATVTVNGGAAGSQTVPVTLTVTADPPPPVTPPVSGPSVSQVVNAATFGATPLVAGSLATVMGSRLTGKSVSVTFDDAPAKILWAGESQINLQVPAGLGARSAARVVVTADGVSSAAVPVSLAAAWPSVFAHGVLNQDSGENSAAAPARAGEVLQVFATGIPRDAVVTARIGGGAGLAPLYAGEAPTVPGVQQVNVAVPDGVGQGAGLMLCASVAGAAEVCSAEYALAVK
jgi:uncharacterized protein (TIGR03437 family)